MAWKTKVSKEIYKSNYMLLTRDRGITSFGKKLIYEVVHKKPFALIIPWDGKRFILVGQYRYTVNQFSWEFPAGHFQEGGIEKTAAKELEEETGMGAKSIKKIGIFHPASGFLDQECHVFLATNLVPGKIDRDIGEEGMRMKKVTKQELEKMIKGGKIKNGPTITAFTILGLKNLI